MMLVNRLNFFSPASLNPGGTTLLGSGVRLALERTWPLYEILVWVYFTAHGTPPSTMTADGPLKILKRVNLSITDGSQPRSVVDFTGPGLLEYAAQTGLNLDAPTLAVLAEMTKATPGLTASNLYRICYRIPIVHPMITEPLRTRCLLPIHLLDQDPILSLDFASAAEMYGAGSLTAVGCDFALVRAQMSQEFNRKIVADGGYLKHDLIETPFTVGTGVSGETRFTIPSPGQYAGLMLRHYKGGASVTRADMSESTTAGSESRWRVESNNAAIREWRQRHVKSINEFSRPLNATTQTSSPNFMGALTSGTQYQDPNSTYLDFLTDGLDAANELGSLLDTNFASQTGLKMEVVGNVASVATNASTLYIGGQRFFGDLSRWQAARSA